MHCISFATSIQGKAIDAVAMDYLNGTFPAFVSPRMSETLIGLHASIDGGKALEPLADAVGYVNSRTHAVHDWENRDKGILEG